MRSCFFVTLSLSLALPFFAASGAQASDPPDVTRATLDNGLRVVIVRDPLAPVATLEQNYLVGGNETPKGFPGTAHAQEHMTFRGCTGLSADQIAAIYAQLGGAMDADTQQTITQYFVTVPSQDLDVALRLDAACMANVQDEQDQWDQERGAIEQEVSRDLSSPTYKLVVRLNHDLFAGSPYENDALGTQPSFDKTTAAMLKEFHDKWYAPNNAILVITGDVDAAATISKIKQYYGAIPRKQIPTHPAVAFQPVKKDSFTMDSNLPYTIATVSFRVPGSSDPDFAAVRILGDVLASQRADLYGLVPQNKALSAGAEMLESFPQASVLMAFTAIPPNADAAASTNDIQAILAGYAAHGVPPDLVEAAKKGEVAGAEFGRNSISNLASLWSQALADEGRQSPDQDVEAVKKVTVDDVNRAAKKYLVPSGSITAILKPAASGEAVESKGFGGSEKTTSTPTKPVQLPEWAEEAVKSLRVPKSTIRASDVTLSNGIRLIVQTEKTSPTITLQGSIKTQDQMETPPGKDGVSDILDGLFSYGTKTLDRIAFQKALDDIAAAENAGSSFGLKVLKADFDRGLQLLADNELHPALPEDAFKVVQQQTAELAGGTIQSPGYRFERALAKALLPAGDPLLREMTPKTVSDVAYSDVNVYYQKAFRPDLTTIVVIGDITPEEARPLVEKYFGEWKASGAKPDVTLPPVPGNKASAVNVPDPSQVQDTVQLAEELEMNRFSPDYYALQLGNHVLGGGFYATRLYRDLREKAGYVYNIDNSLQAGETRAQYLIDYGCDPKNVGKAREMIQGELVAMQKFDVSPSELQQAKALLLRQIPLSQASEDDLVAGMIARARVGLPLDEQFRAAGRYFDITADQIRAAFAKWIDPANFVQVVRGPAPQ
jgi:zinc protease